MASKATRLVVTDGKHIVHSINLRIGKEGPVTRIKALRGGKFVLGDAETGSAPLWIDAHRVGNDLHVALDGRDPGDPDLIIEDFYAPSDAPPQLMGLGEDGKYHAYVALDAQADHAVGLLADGMDAPQVLSRTALPGPGGVLAAGPATGGPGGWLFGTVGALLAATLIPDRDAPSRPNPPSAPSVTDVLDDQGTLQGRIAPQGLTNDARPTIAGAAQANAVVAIYADGVLLGSTTADAQGRWSFTPTAALGDGAHQISATATLAGLVSPASAPYAITVDTRVEPSNASLAEDTGTATSAIAEGATTNDATPVYAGKAEARATVTVYDNAVAIGTAQADASGNWRFVPLALDDGPHSFTHTVTDLAGNLSVPSVAIHFTVDTLAQPPLIENAVDAVGTTEDIASGGLTNDPRPTFSGTGEPGAIVTLRDGTTVLGSAVVGPDGGWAISPIVDLTDGRHSLVATQVDPAGNVSGGSTPYVVNVDLVAQPPLIENAVDAVGTTEDIASGGLTNDPRPTFSGTGEPGAIVTLRDGTTVLGSAVVGPDGGWTISPIVDLTDGRHSLVATQVDPAGNVSGGSTPYVVNVDLVAQPPLIENAVDAVGTTEDIASGGLTNDPRPTFSGTGEPGAIVTLRDGTTVLGSAVVGPDGGWTISPIVDLTDGRHSLVATQVDPAGNVSGGSTPYVVNVDLVAQPPLIENAVDAVGTTEDIASGGLTNDPRPTFSGTGEPGAIVTLRDGTTVLGSAVVGPDGGWTISPIVDLTDGHHSLVATQVDPAGNVSGGSTPYVVNVDLVAQPPLIENAVDAVGTTEDIASGGLTNDPRPTFSGTGEPGAIVTLRDGTTVLGSAVVGPDGGWTISPIVDLADGRHSLVATQVDPAGNASAASAPYVLNVDVTAPASASIDSMGRDSGSDNNDFLTNDGSPGRLIQGTLSAALLAGEKVQVSVDGGNTWTDAIVNGDTWSILDGTAHTGDWIIQSRVVDAAGNVSEVVSQAVTLDTVAPNAPAALSFDGATVTVHFDGTGLRAGDKVQVVIGSERFEQTLTEAQISAGSVDVVTRPAASLLNTVAAIVDQAGNASPYLSADSFGTDFENVPVGRVPASGSQDFGVFTFTWFNPLTTAGVVGPGAPIHPTYGAPSTGLVVHSAVPGVAGRLVLADGASANAVSFDAAALDSPVHVNFYDANHNQVFTTLIADGVVISHDAVYVQLPEGVSFTSLEFVPVGAAGSELFFIDNIAFATGDDFHPMTLPSLQSIDEAGSYYGDATGNTFSIADIAILDNAVSVIHGGAGIDTLTLTGANQVLDLDAMAGKIESVEIIDLTGTGNNTLNLSLKDVLEQGSKDLFVTDGKTQMLVKGNAGDVVNLDDLLNGADVGDWSQMAGEVTVGGVAYDVFQHSGLEAELLVQQGVTTNLV